MTLSIRHSATVALAIGMATLLLAACGGDDNDDGGSPTARGSELVSIQSVDGTDVLADSAGRTLYTAEVEMGGIRCTDGCTSFWDPVSASAADSDAAATELDLDLGVTERPDGDRQLTFRGLPLYRFTEEGPGELEGDGFVDDFQGTRFEWAAAMPGDAAGSAGFDAPRGTPPY